MHLPVEKTGLIPLCTAQQMKNFDETTILSGTPGKTLMENAAQAVVVRALSLLGADDRPVVVVCGAGNNGGDGYAVARLLAEKGLRVTVVVLGAADMKVGDARENRKAWEALGGVVSFPEQADVVLEKMANGGLLVDALFGTGLTRPLSEDAEKLVQIFNASPAPFKLAVDLPSGVHSDTGQVMGAAMDCSHTVSFQLPKMGCFQEPGRSFCGSVEVVDISVAVDWNPDDLRAFVLGEKYVARLLPSRPPAGHKGTFGHLLAFCGSVGMGGAAMLVGRAALKTGAGLVTLGVPRGLRDRFLDQAPELMTLASSFGGEAFFESAHIADFQGAAMGGKPVVLGCGLGQQPETGAFVQALVASLENPLLIDADGLNHLNGENLKARAHPTIITPHPGEMARLSGLPTNELARDRPRYARQFAKEWGVVLVLKGAGTIIAEPGGEIFINPTGDAGLATAGTGDVLAGMIGGLMAQGLAPLQAAQAGVYLHGLARDIQAGKIVQAAFTASNLLEGINLALKHLGAP